MKRTLPSDCGRAGRVLARAAPAFLGLLLLQRGAASAQAAQPAPPQASASPSAPLPLAGYEDGFFLRSPGGDFVLTLEGLLQVQGRAFEGGLGRISELDLERMRFELSGEIQRLYLFRVEPSFTEDEVELEEAWVGADLGANGPRLVFGRRKEPFSLEEMLPRKHLDFATFSILNQLVPAEDHGVTLIGGGLERSCEYGAALYNGTGGDDLNSDKDVALRGVVRPFAARERSLLRGFQVGAALTHGRADSDVAGEELRTEARVPFLAFEPGSELDGTRTRLGLESAWLRGPIALYAEAMSMTQEMQGPVGEAEIGFDGWYVGASWVLTGEEKTFRGVHPRAPLEPTAGSLAGHGAWQLAARLSSLSLDDDLLAIGSVAPSAFPDDVTSASVGLNWYASYNARVKLHFLHTRYGDEITLDGEPRDSENALLLQLQLHF